MSLEEEFSSLVMEAFLSLADEASSNWCTRSFCWKQSKAISAFTLHFSHTLLHYWHPAHTQQGHQHFHTALLAHSPPLLTPCTHTRPSALSHSFLTLSSTTDTLHTHNKAISAFTLLFSHTLCHYWHPAHTQGHQHFHTLFSHSPPLLTPCTHNKAISAFTLLFSHTLLHYWHAAHTERLSVTWWRWPHTPTLPSAWKLIWDCNNHYGYLLLVKLKKQKWSVSVLVTGKSAWRPVSKTIPYNARTRGFWHATAPLCIMHTQEGSDIQQHHSVITHTRRFWHTTAHSA